MERAAGFLRCTPVPNPGAMSESVNATIETAASSARTASTQLWEAVTAVQFDLTTKDARDFSYFGKSSE
jgi:hypothetical protein